MNAEIRSVIRCALEAAIEDYYLSGESVQAFEDALAWLDAQPAAPEEMTIPEDVRNWIASAAQVASDSARYYDVDPSTSDAVLAWLDAQPEAPGERWEPVEDMRWLGGLHSFNDIRVIDGMILGVWLSAPGVPPVTANIELPADLRLCRRVEVKP